MMSTELAALPMVWKSGTGTRLLSVSCLGFIQALFHLLKVYVVMCLVL